jgi:hypothetical protein
MFSSIFNKNSLANTTLSKYCIQSTNESIRKMVEKYNKEMKEIKKPEINFDLLIQDSSGVSNNNNIFFIQFFCFLSTSTFIYYLLNKKQ